MFTYVSRDSAQSSGGTVVSITVFVNSSATDVTAQTVEPAFISGLTTQNVGGITKRVLGNDYVLATSSDGVNFTPSLSNVVGKTG